MRDNLLEMTALICGECGGVIEILTGNVEPIFPSKPCECGGYGFFPYHFKIAFSFSDTSVYIKILWEDDTDINWDDDININWEDGIYVDWEDDGEGENPFLDFDTKDFFY
jgi:hypothetical protein